MGQQALSTRVVGSTLVVETRLNLNMQSLTLEEVTSKRRKVVKDMVENVLADFGGEGKQYLEGLLEPLHTEPPEYYNWDENLGAAINDAVFRSNAVRGWAEGLKVLPESILERESLTLETTDATIWDGIGATLHHGKLQTLKCVRLHFPPDSTALNRSPPCIVRLAGLGAAGAKRLSLELATAPRLTELECASSPAKISFPSDSCSPAVRGSLTKNDLTNNQTDFSGLAALSKCLTSNSSLKTIRYASFHLPSVVWLSCLLSFGDRLDDNNIGAAGAAEVARHIPKWSVRELR